MASAMWKYMTPFPPNPSIHDIVVGNFVPNSFDLYEGLTDEFHSTVIALNGYAECDMGYETEGSLLRAGYYSDWLTVFGLEPETGLSCATTNHKFFEMGSGGIWIYW